MASYRITEREQFLNKVVPQVPSPFSPKKNELGVGRDDPTPSPNTSFQDPNSTRPSYVAALRSLAKRGSERSLDTLTRNYQETSLWTSTNIQLQQQVLPESANRFVQRRRSQRLADKAAGSSSQNDTIEDLAALTAQLAVDDSRNPPPAPPPPIAAPAPYTIDDADPVQPSAILQALVTDNPLGHLKSAKNRKIADKPLIPKPKVDKGKGKAASVPVLQTVPPLAIPTKPPAPPTENKPPISQQTTLTSFQEKEHFCSVWERSVFQVFDQFVTQWKATEATPALSNEEYTAYC